MNSMVNETHVELRHGNARRHHLADAVSRLQGRVDASTTNATTAPAIRTAERRPDFRVRPDGGHVDVYDAMHAASAPTMRDGAVVMRYVKLRELERSSISTSQLVDRISSAASASYPVGTLVQARKRAAGRGDDGISADLLRPVVRVVYDGKRRCRITPTSSTCRRNRRTASSATNPPPEMGSDPDGRPIKNPGGRSGFGPSYGMTYAKFFATKSQFTRCSGKSRRTRRRLR